jgi:putative nucleotidyltransferase with HDIG domain
MSSNLPSPPPRPRLSLLRHSRKRGPAAWPRQAGELWSRTFDLPALWLVLFLIVGTWTIMPSGFLFAPRAEVGAIAGRDYIAPRDLLVDDVESTVAKQTRAREGVLPVYDFDPAAEVDRDGEIAALFKRGRELLSAGGGRRDRAEVLKALAEETQGGGTAHDGLRVTPEQLELLARKQFSADLEDRIRGLLSQALHRGVVANKPALLENRMRGVTVRNLATGGEQTQLDLFTRLGFPEEAREFLESQVRGWTGLSAGERRLIVDFLFHNLPVDLHLNQSETKLRRDGAAKAAGKVFSQVSKGQVIVRKGDQISPTEARMVAEARGDRHLAHQLPPIAGTLVLMGLTALALWYGPRAERLAERGRGRVFGELLLLSLVSLLGAKFCFLVAGALARSFATAPMNVFQSYAYAVPFAALALLAAMLLGRQPALMLAFLFPVLAARMVDVDALWVVLYGSAGSLAAVFALDRVQFKQRLVMARVGLAVGGVNVLMILILSSLGGIAERGAAQVGFDIFCGFAGGLLVSAVASFAVPILESALDITTDIKLVELANTNLPLLRRLAFEAPGTFQHSLMVANLAKEGCEAIGADPVLAYTGGLYHDLGKIFRPDYFIENQRPGQNRHDKLLPSMSALILINHVKEGLELAREDNLPRPVRDAIAQHHGTRLIKYFYNRALEQGGAAEVEEEKYRYPGPKPQNKVMGVLMLADGIEAASRTLVEPTTPKIRALIRTIVEDCLRDGQLDQTDLTLSDISRLGESFLRVLATIFHQRIDYPGFNFNAEPQEPRAVTGAADAARAS